MHVHGVEVHAAPLLTHAHQPDTRTDMTWAYTPCTLKTSDRVPQLRVYSPKPARHAYLTCTRPQ